MQLTYTYISVCVYIHIFYIFLYTYTQAAPNAAPGKDIALQRTLADWAKGT